MAKLNFQQALLQSSAFTDLLFKNHVFLLSMLKTVVLINIFMETMIHDCQDSLKNRKLKTTAFIWIKGVIWCFFKDHYFVYLV